MGEMTPPLPTARILTTLFACYSHASTPTSQSLTQPTSESSHINAGVPVGTHPSGSLVPYQMHQRSYTSSSGSGHTTWYFAKSNARISCPPTVSQAMTGHLYVHLDRSTNSFQYWILGTNNQWETVSKGAENPLNHDRILSIRSNGEPSWITRASTITTQCRKEKETRENRTLS
jgi:hypothetical protein